MLGYAQDETFAAPIGAVVPALILLCHKACRIARVKLRAQHGHLGSVRAIATASLRWMVAIELGT